MLSIRIAFPFDAVFQTPEFESNSRELRSIVLQNYLMNSGMELGGEVEAFQVKQFNGEDNGEFWDVEKN